MSDPVGLIGSGGAGGIRPRPNMPAANTQDANSPKFGDVLRTQLNEVNAMQQDASKAVEDLMTGNRDDVEGVILATEKADTAFRMLQSMRNKVMDAYEEVKQIRV